LPDIGSKLARRIISFRDKLGGFHSVEQVKETYGLPDSTFQKISSLLQVATDAVHRIDINTADLNTLAQHPYIGRNIANAIVKYREQHGPFKSLNDLQEIVLITSEIFKKIVQYLAVAE
jgi:competence ComEA-like helix-hairpin-helix protein